MKGEKFLLYVQAQATKNEKRCQDPFLNLFFILGEDQNFNLSFKSGGILTIFPSLSTKA